MTLLTFAPSATNHDAWQGNSAVMTLTGEIRVASGVASGGFLLTNANIPAGANITSATIFYQAIVGTHDSPDQDWYAEATDHAAVFTTTAGNIGNRQRTTAVTNDTATDIGTTGYRAVNITSQIAEVTARAGWAAGNNIALIAKGLGASANLWIHSYDSGGSTWYVEINYTEAGANNLPQKTMYYTRLKG